MKVQRSWLLLAALPLATGAALIVHVLTSISLGYALLFAAIVVIFTATLTWRNLPQPARREIVLRVRAGTLAGLVATICYDLFRWLLVNVFHYTFWPFDIFRIFGFAIAGPGTAIGTATVIGVVYHYANGILFAIAYAILLAPRGWWTGLLWALGLEALMLSIYPGWLHIKAFDEFLSVSMLGHIMYGLILGIGSRWLLTRQRIRNQGTSRLRLNNN